MSPRSLPVSARIKSHMMTQELRRPSLDPTPLFELFRGSYATELLTAAVAEFDVFNRLSGRPLPLAELATALGLQPRAAVVLLTALRAMGLIVTNAAGLLQLSELAEQHLTRGSAFDVSGYIGLAAASDGVRQMVERLRSNRPAGAQKGDEGTAFIYREGTASAMDREASARALTLALAGRAKNVAPVLAERVPLDAHRCLLDMGGGTGIYSFAYLQRQPKLQAIIWDRPEVLKVAQELAVEYGVADRCRFESGDMFVDPVPADADVCLLSNILHDWDVSECAQLVERCAAALPRGGRLIIHDVLLNDEMDGPLPIALYSAALFTLTEGRAYSAAEFRGWQRAAALECEPAISTLVHAAALPAIKR